MDTPASSLRRKSQVFVEIPPSPLHSTTADRSIQETTPLNAVVMNVDNHPITSNASKSLKRKPSENQIDALRTRTDIQSPRLKRLKAESSATPDAPATKAAAKTGRASNATGNASESQEAKFWCHQCSRKFESSAIARCTFKRPAGQRCVYNYCKACLRNRYQQDTDAIKSRSLEDYPAFDRAKHASNVDYIFQCPRCSGECNCRACRKGQNLPATGNLALSARKPAEEATTTRQNVPAAAGPSTSNGKDKRTGKVAAKSKDRVRENKATVKEKKSNAQRRLIASKPKPHVLVPPSPYKIDSVVFKKPRAIKPKPERAPKPIPKPVWTTVFTPLTFEGALERMHIREFLLRFAHLTDIARGYLEELEDLVTDDPYLEMTDQDKGSGATPLVGWISEPALRSIVIGLLTLVLKDTEKNGDDASVVAKGIQQVRNSGINLSKMWSALSSLRDEASLEFPDPLLAPPSAAPRDTRSGALVRDGTNVAVVVSTAQLVPIVSALIETALRTTAVKDDFERGAAQEKDLARAVRELSSAENTRWKDKKAAGTIVAAKKRAAKHAHDATLARFDFAHRVAASECLARFCPLGRDVEGRVYYALMPGELERAAALDVLEGGTGEIKLGKRRHVAQEDARKEMKHWSWFVAVWGSKPADALVAKNENEEEVESADVCGDSARWWGFWQPEEVTKLAEWLAMKHGIDLDTKHSSKTSDDSAVVEVDHADGEKKLDERKARGRPSNTSSAASSALGRTFASLNNESDSEDEGRVSGGTDEDEDVLMHMDEYGEPVPTKQDMRVLARRLKEYAELLAWRIERVTESNKDNKKSSGLEKGKSAPKIVPGQAISPATFYGKG